MYALSVLLPQLRDLLPADLWPVRHWSSDAIYAFDTHGAAICAPGTHNFGGRAGNVYQYVRVASPTADALSSALTTMRGNMAVESQWATCLDQIAAAARAARTVDQLLRHSAGREACNDCVRTGKTYSARATVYARRSIVVGAVARLAVRAARRAARAVPETLGLTFVDKRAALLQGRIDRVRDAVAVVARGLYRVAESKWAGGDHYLDVKIGSPAVDGGTNRVRSSKSKWPGNNSHAKYSVPADWIATVLDRDLAVVDGMLTLSAVSVPGHGPELYHAAWVEQGRGCSLNLSRGYIARLTHDGSTYTYHAASARAAIAGVQIKAKMKPARRKGGVGLDRLVRRYGDLPVYWADSDGIACASGTRNWCEAVGIDPSGTTVTEVVAGYRLRPMPEALQILRRVVRDRHNRQPLDLTVPESSIEQPGRVIFDSEGGFSIVPSEN